MARRPRQDDGFTLLEIIATLLILAMVMAMMAGVALKTIQAHSIIESQVDQPRAGALILRQIQSDLQLGILPDPEALQFRGQDLYQSDEADRIDFITTAFSFDAGEDDEDETLLGVYGDDDDNQPVPTSVNEVGYLCRDNDDIPGLMILYRREDTFIDDEPVQGGTLMPLSDRVKLFRVEYYDGTQWLPEWDNTQNQIEEENSLPLAVRVTLGLVASSDVEAKKDPEDYKVREYSIVVPMLR